MLTGASDILPPGVTTMKMQDIAKLTEIRASLAPEPPRKRRPKTAKRKSSSDDDGELFGTRIQETKT
jgi:hypothetical protein